MLSELEKGLSVDIREKLKTRPIIRPPLIIPCENGFQLDGWKTPEGVALGLEENKIDPEKFGQFLDEAYCRPSGYEFKGITTREDGVLQSIGVKRGEKTSYVELVGVDSLGQGEYQLKEATNGRVAIMLQAFLARYINYLQPKRELTSPHLDTSVRGHISYFPVNLKLPGFIMRIEQPLTDPDYQDSLTKRAVETAKRLGLTINPRDGFTFRNGLLAYATVEEGNACHYILDSSGFYGEHNVDIPEQAITLHWACGTFIRELADKLSS